MRIKTNKNIISKVFGKKPKTPSKELCFMNDSATSSDSDSDEDSAEDEEKMLHDEFVEKMRDHSK